MLQVKHTEIEYSHQIYTQRLQIQLQIAPDVSEAPSSNDVP